MGDLILLCFQLEREVLALDLEAHVIDERFVTMYELDEVFGGSAGEFREGLRDALRDLDFYLSLFLALLFFRGLGTLGDDR